MSHHHIAYVSGRGILSSLFILGAVNKLLNYQATLESMTAAGLTPAALLLPATIALEAIGGLYVAFGISGAWIAASLLGLFTLATNIFFHRFWELAPPLAPLELSLFFKNVAIAGGLLAVAAVEFQRRAAGPLAPTSSKGET